MDTTRELAAIRKITSCPRMEFNGVVLRCEGQRHDEGGRAHSANIPDGLLLWWVYGNGRVAKVLRTNGAP